MISCCIGIMAYNEESNIAAILEALLNQKAIKTKIEKIVVVSSGSTDRTNEIVRQFQSQSGIIELVLQKEREGKASAINLFMSLNKQYEIIVFESADTVPEIGTIEALVAPFEDPRVGMVGGHPIPTNEPDKFIGFAINLLWEMHHQISMIYPKMGELIAFRNIFRQIPNETAVDEASIEPLIVGQGLKLVYAPDAVVYNRGPETIRDYFKQRRRIFSGHLYVKEMLGYCVSTMNGFRLFRLFLSNTKLNLKYILWSPFVIVMEIITRLLASYDYKVKHKNPYKWDIVSSTKKLKFGK